MGKGTRLGSIVKGMMFGWLVGSTVALISTPRPGDETRAMLREKGTDLKNRVQSTAVDARQRVETLTQKGSERASGLKQQSQEFMKTQKVNLQSAAEGIKEGVRAYKEEDPSIGSGPIQPAPPSDLSTDLLDTNTAL